MNERIREDPLEEASPVFSSWTHWYFLVLGFLAFFILFLYLFTKAFD